MSAYAFQSWHRFCRRIPFIIIWNQAFFHSRGSLLYSYRSSGVTVEVFCSHAFFIDIYHYSLRNSLLEKCYCRPRSWWSCCRFSALEMEKVNLAIDSLAIHAKKEVSIFWALDERRKRTVDGRIMLACIPWSCFQQNLLFMRYVINATSFITLTFPCMCACAWVGARAVMHARRVHVPNTCADYAKRSIMWSCDGWCRDYVWYVVTSIV